MSLWLTMAAALAGLAMAALVLWPLRQRSQRSFVVGCGSLAVAAACLYVLVGTPQAVTGQAGAPSTQTLRVGVQALQQALAQDPQRADGWALLGRSQQELGDHPSAAVAFERAVTLAPDDPGLLVEAAQARARIDADKRFDDTAMGWLRHALAVAPDAERASWLLGIGLRQRGQDQQAAQVWEALLPRLQPAAAQALQEQIAVARQASAQAPGPVPDPPVAATAPGLAINLHLPAGFNAADWPTSAAVFVLARAIDGPPMPVAVKRFPLAQVPAQVRLDDSDSPMPTQPLSSHAVVEVLVRISRNGSAERSEGDLQGTPVRVTLPAAAPVDLHFQD